MKTASLKRNIPILLYIYVWVSANAVVGGKHESVNSVTQIYSVQIWVLVAVLRVM